MWGELEKISKEELEKILDDHRAWVESDGKEGNRADLSYISLIGANRIRANLVGANLVRAHLKRAYLRGANLRGADLRRAILRLADLFKADLGKADLGMADLSMTDLRETNLHEANLFGANLGEANLFGAKLFGAKLFGANLFGANLGGADLSEADLGRAYLSEAKLSKADLRGADLSEAKLRMADLRGADLIGANLIGADLIGANLVRADLSGADFADATILKTKASNRAQLTGAKNIEDPSGFIFEEDELKQEKGNREKRAEKIFDVNEKGTISLSIPSTLPPLLVAQVIACVSIMAEGVRLAFTADYETSEQLGHKVANSALWTGKEEKYAARIVALNLRNPIDLTLENIRDLGQIIANIIAVSTPLFLGYLTYKGSRRKQELIHEREIYKAELHHERANRELEMQEKMLPVPKEDEEARAVILASQRTVDSMPEETKALTNTIIGELAGDVDNQEERTSHAVEFVVRMMNRLRSLLRGEDAKFSINGEDIDLNDPDPDKDSESEKSKNRNPTGKPEE